MNDNPEMNNNVRMEMDLDLDLEPNDPKVLSFFHRFSVPWLIFVFSTWTFEDHPVRS